MLFPAPRKDASAVAVGTRVRKSTVFSLLRDQSNGWAKSRNSRGWARDSPFEENMETRRTRKWSDEDEMQSKASAVQDDQTWRKQGFVQAP